MEYTSFNGEQEVYDMFEYRESSREGVFTENLDTQILDKKKSTDTMTLYHGTLADVKVIKPLSVNMGNLLSPGIRNSSFWSDKKEVAEFWAIIRALQEIPHITNQKEKKIYLPDFIEGPNGEQKKIDINTYRKAIANRLQTMSIYVYQANNVPVKKISKGQINISEYTVDEDVVPDKKISLTVDDVMKYLKCVPKEEMDRQASISKDTSNRTKKSSLLEKIVFGNEYKKMQKRAKVVKARANLYQSLADNKKV